MARFRNVSSGVVVNVDDSKRLGSEWEAVKSPTPRATPKRGRQKKTASE